MRAILSYLHAAACRRHAHFRCRYCISWPAEQRTLRRMVKLATVIIILVILDPLGMRAQTGAENSRRISMLEAVQADVRLAALEARFNALDREQDRRISKLENLGYSILAAVAGQLVLSGASLTVRRRRDQGEG